jgi:hypothetical protein
MSADIEFTSFAVFGLYVEEMSRRTERAMGDSLEGAAYATLAEVREMFGHYQSAEGPFPAWAPLAQATLERRAQRAINPNDEPLLESGDLEASYIVERFGNGQVAVGSDSEYAEAQETGNDRIPPRPVLGPALLRVERKGLPDTIRDIFVEVLLNGRYFRDLKKSRARMDSLITPSYGRGTTFSPDDF